jgi:hypothetical protein
MMPNAHQEGAIVAANLDDWAGRLAYWLKIFSALTPMEVATTPPVTDNVSNWGNC